jgi:hypothetical protein
MWHKRKRARINQRLGHGHSGNPCQSPEWWDILHNRRPMRRKEELLSRRALFGWIDVEEAAWPNGRKPQSFYW